MRRRGLKPTLRRCARRGRPAGAVRRMASMQAKRPLLAITIGDPSGVGPETIVAAWSDPRIHQWCNAVVIGHPTFLRRAVDLLDSTCRIVTVDDVAAAQSAPNRIPCLPSGPDSALDAPPATIDPRSGQAAYEAVVLPPSWPWPADRRHRDRPAPQGGPLAGRPSLSRAIPNCWPNCAASNDFAMMLYLAPGRDRFAVRPGWAWCMSRCTWRCATCLPA